MIRLFKEYDVSTEPLFSNIILTVGQNIGKTGENFHWRYWAEVGG